MVLKAEDLMQRIRERAREHGRANGAAADVNDPEVLLARLRANVTAARRAQDQLPPLTTYRNGLRARLELWIKRRLKRATHWFTWQQTNFNAATVRALEDVGPMLARIDESIAGLNAGLTSAEAEDRMTELQTAFAALRETFNALLTNVHDLRIEERKLAEEHRVCFKQLSLQITESATFADRAKRSLQLQLAELEQRVDQLAREAAKRTQ